MLSFTKRKTSLVSLSLKYYISFIFKFKYIYIKDEDLLSQKNISYYDPFLQDKLLDINFFDHLNLLNKYMAFRKYFADTGRNFFHFLEFINFQLEKAYFFLFYYFCLYEFYFKI